MTETREFDLNDFTNNNFFTSFNDLSPELICNSDKCKPLYFAPENSNSPITPDPACKSLSCIINGSSLPTSGNQYQTQKLIQNTVRVPASVYIQNLRALNSYQFPSLLHQGVYWQQSSDRKFRHIQKVTVPTRGNSLRSSITRFDRPGCSSPGGAGVDIKHGSYQRYLNRLMAKGPLRREKVPPTFGLPIPFNPAFPIYGNKTIKTNIINKCICTSRV